MQNFKHSEFFKIPIPLYKTIKYLNSNKTMNKMKKTQRNQNPTETKRGKKQNKDFAYLCVKGPNLEILVKKKEILLKKVIEIKIGVEFMLLKKIGRYIISDPNKDVFNSEQLNKNNEMSRPFKKNVFYTMLIGSYEEDDEEEEEEAVEEEDEILYETEKEKQVTGENKGNEQEIESEISSNKISDSEVD